MGFIQGRNRMQLELIPRCLEDYIDENNPVRVIDALIEYFDLEKLGFKRVKPNQTGRPSYDPKDMMKLYLYGYYYKIRSSRMLENETKRNVEVMWLIRELKPDHKTISEFRRLNKQAMKRVFKEFVNLCKELGLYGKKLVAIDGSKFAAQNGNGRNYSQNKIKKILKKTANKIEDYEKYLEELEKADAEDNETTVIDVKETLEKLKERKAKYEAMKEELQEKGETQKSLTDPDSRMIKDDVVYNVQTAVDAKNKLIADFDVTNDINDNHQLASMSIKAKEALEVEEITTVEDKGYDNATEIYNCLKNGIRPEVAGLEKGIQFCVPCERGEEALPESYENGRIIYVEERNLVLCPMGEILYPKSYQKSKGSASFRNKEACANCKNKCVASEYPQVVIRMKPEEFSEEYNETGLKIKQITYKSNLEIVRERKSIVEHPYGVTKRSMGADYCLTKGLANVTSEFALLFLTFNLKRVINIMGIKKIMAVLEAKKADISLRTKKSFVLYFFIPAKKLKIA